MGQLPGAISYIGRRGFERAVNVLQHILALGGAISPVGRCKTEANVGSCITYKLSNSHCNVVIDLSQGSNDNS